MSGNDPRRLDADEGIFFKRQLEYVKEQTYDEKLQELRYKLFLPVSGEAPSGATEITWRSFKTYARAKIISDYAKDFPRVDLGGEEHTIKIKDLGVSFGYTIKDIRKAALAKVPLEQRKASGARRAIEEQINSLAWNGDTDYGIQGFIKYPGTTEYVAPATGTGTSKLWSTKTPDQILTDLNGLVNAVWIPTRGREMVNVILLTQANLSLIKNTRVGSTSDTTIFKFFMDNNPGIRLDWLAELEDAGTSGTDMATAFTSDSLHVTLEVPVAFEMFEESHEGMEYVIPCHAEVGGVIVYYPMSVSWTEGI